MKTVQKYLQKSLGSRKFQVFITALLLFIFVDRFSADHLIIVMFAYIGANVLQKIIEGKLIG